MEELFIIADGEAVAAAQSTAAQTTTVQTVSQDGASATQANQQAAPAGGLMSMLPLILIFSRLWGIDGVLYAGPVADGTAAGIALLLLAHETRHMRALSAGKNTVKGRQL